MVRVRTPRKRTANWTKLNAEDFRKLAEIRLSEAQALLDNRKFDGAFYLAGYAVECGLKACIANLTRRGDFPPEPKVVRESFYTHTLETLFDTALKGGALEDMKRQDSQFRAQWLLVKDWKETSRYENHDEKKARDMITSSQADLPRQQSAEVVVFQMNGGNWRTSM